MKKQKTQYQNFNLDIVFSIFSFHIQFIFTVTPRRIKQNAAPGDKLFLNSSLVHKRYLKTILKDRLTVYFYQLSEKNFTCSHSVPRIISTSITLMFEIEFPTIQNLIAENHNSYELSRENCFLQILAYLKSICYYGHKSNQFCPFLG